MVFQRAGCGLRGGCDLLWLVGEDGGVEFEGWLDQCDELCGWGYHLPVDLADGVGDGQVGQVHGDQVGRLGDEVRAEPEVIRAYLGDTQEEDAHAGAA